MTTNVCVAGATGWTGRPIAEAVAAADDLVLRSAVSRSAAGQDLGAAWGRREPMGVPVFGSVVEAVDGVDVLIDYTSDEVVRTNTLTAIEHGVSVVIGTSGLTADDFAEIDRAAAEAEVGVVAAGNFSLTAAMAQAAALLVARHLPCREVIDYASAGKPDAPSGTARELAERLADVRPNSLDVPPDRTRGAPDARGTTVRGTQVHSVRLPSFVVSTEAIFALPDERLSIRHDAGSTPTPTSPARCSPRASSPAAPASRGDWTPFCSAPRASRGPERPSVPRSRAASRPTHDVGPCSTRPPPPGRAA